MWLWLFLSTILVQLGNKYLKIVKLNLEKLKDIFLYGDIVILMKFYCNINNIYVYNVILWRLGLPFFPILIWFFAFLFIHQIHSNWFRLSSIHVPWLRLIFRLILFSSSLLWWKHSNRKYKFNFQLQRKYLRNLFINIRLLWFRIKQNLFISLCPSNSIDKS